MGLRRDAEDDAVHACPFLEQIPVQGRTRVTISNGGFLLFVGECHKAKVGKQGVPVCRLASGLPEPVTPRPELTKPGGDGGGKCCTGGIWSVGIVAGV